LLKVSQHHTLNRNCCGRYRGGVGGALRLSSPPEGRTAGFEALLIFPQFELAPRGLLTEKPRKRRQLSSTKPLEVTTVGICDDGAITPRQGVCE
jgi:hypothetical protein